MTALLMEAERYPEVLKVCEQALLIEPYEEELHLRFVEALLETGKIKQARSHYEYVTSMFYRELGVKPSPAMRDLYRRTQVDNANIELDLTCIQESLAEKSEAQGAFVCDPNVFRFLYKLEKRRAERSGQAMFLGLIRSPGPITDCRPRPSSNRRWNGCGSISRQTCAGVTFITRWNEAQFLIILPGLSLEQAEKVLGRIEKQFREKYRTEDVALRPKVQSLLPA